MSYKFPYMIGNGRTRKRSGREWMEVSRNGVKYNEWMLRIVQVMAWTGKLGEDRWYFIMIFYVSFF